MSEIEEKKSCASEEKRRQYEEIKKFCADNNIKYIGHIYEDKDYSEFEFLVDSETDYRFLTTVLDWLMYTQKVKQISFKKENNQTSLVIRDESRLPTDDVTAFFLARILEEVTKGDYKAFVSEHTPTFFDLFKTVMFSKEDIDIEYMIHAKRMELFRRGELEQQFSEQESIKILRKLMNDPEYSNTFENTGDAIREKIPEESIELAAKSFSEGRKSLEDVLLFCMKNNIRTFACCAGHDILPGVRGKAYLSFALENEDVTRNLVIGLFSSELTESGIDKLDFSTRVDDDGNVVENANIYIEIGREDEVFKRLEEKMAQLINRGNLPISPVILDMYIASKKFIGKGFSFDGATEMIEFEGLDISKMSLQDAQKWFSENLTYPKDVLRNEDR